MGCKINKILVALQHINSKTLGSKMVKRDCSSICLRTFCLFIRPFQGIYVSLYPEITKKV